MIVLDGATSQWKRCVASSRAIGPAVASPAAMRSIASRCGRTASGVEVGRERGQPALVELRARGEVAERPAEDDHARVDPLAALDPRHDADDRVRERATARSRASSAVATKARGASSRAQR